MLYSIINFFTADVLNKIYEVKMLRTGETAVMIVDHCILLEYFTGKSYSYRVVNVYNLKSKHLFSLHTPMPSARYNETAERILESAINYLPEGAKPLSSNERAKNLLAYIFTNILPKHGMPVREKQYELSMEILQGLQNNKLMLCEAKVGTGKTHAYTLAITVHNLFSTKKKPVIISTSTIALQKSLTEEYFPQMSKILMEHKIIDKPLTFAVRKGKSHYICDSRLKTYRCSIQNNKLDKDRELLSKLLDMSAGDTIDLDEFQLSHYVKERVCVSNCGESCAHSDTCRYMNFTRTSMTVPYDFLVTNHNYLFADVVNRKNGGKGLLPESGIRVFDEAHKFIDAARQMYSATLADMMIPNLVRLVESAKDSDKNKAMERSQLCQEIERYNRDVFRELISGLSKTKIKDEDEKITVTFTTNSISCLSALIIRIRKLSGLFYSSDPRRRNKYKAIRKNCELILESLIKILDRDNHICWVEIADKGGYTLCAISKELDAHIYQDVWDISGPCLLTSGTMSVDEDFSLFKAQNGINHMESKRLFETSKPSPFDFKNNALLYIPNHLPSPNSKDEKYIKAITDEIREVILSVHGHTLILFTSYQLMERVFYDIQREQIPFPLFMMKRSKLDTIDAFKNSGNGVLFACNSAGEGIDFPGDIVSCVIEVKLPFLVPDPITEYERTLYGGMGKYLRKVILPTMQKNLTQHFGRGLRLTSDKTVFVILDFRASEKGKFRSEVVSLFPNTCVTSSIQVVAQFIWDNKDEEYFNKSICAEHQ